MADRLCRSLYSIALIQTEHQTGEEFRHFSDKRLADFIDDLLNETLLTLPCLKIRIIGELLHTVKILIDCLDNSGVARLYLVPVEIMQIRLRLCVFGVIQIEAETSHFHHITCPPF